MTDMKSIEAADNLGTSRNYDPAAYLLAALIAHTKARKTKKLWNILKNHNHKKLKQPHIEKEA